MAEGFWPRVFESFCSDIEVVVLGMSLPSARPRREMINVHQVQGDKDAVMYLKNADHDVVEGLFYTAKRYGISTFIFQDQRYDLVRNRDFSFTVRLSDDQVLTPESFS